MYRHNSAVLNKSVLFIVLKSGFHENCLMVVSYMCVRCNWDFSLLVNFLSACLFLMSLLFLLLVLFISLS